MTKKLKMIPCSNCGEPMPELRLTRAGFSYCVTCSENGLGAGRKQGVPIMMGEGDHTWIETVIMDDKQYQQYLRQEKAEKELDKTGKAEMQNMDKEERNLYGPVTIKDTDGKQEEIS
jgi:phosphotransferase system IIA component|tara:strand:- start:100 stop:450 length:351 start_codon:yes stop_codon:yes gene_type:complete